MYNVGYTQYVDVDGGGTYNRVYVYGTGWGNFINPVAELEVTVGTLNTQLENTLNGGA